MKTERRLSDLVSRSFRTLSNGIFFQSILDRVEVRIVEVLPIGPAGVTSISHSPGRPDTWPPLPIDFVQFLRTEHARERRSEGMGLE